jgi:UDP-2,4-diacetamido-2,4,6-trideoxy-beta-L-altropyranose hydrolase
MKVLVYANASEMLGTGHAMRCLALAKELKEQNHQVTFAYSTCLPEITQRYHQGGFNTWALNGTAPSDVLPELTNLIKSTKPDWVIVDWYEAKSDFQTRIKQFSRLMVIDDFKDGTFCSDLILNQNATTPDILKYSLHPESKVLAGPKYALLRPEFSKKAQLFERVIKKRAENILISFGGSDEDNFTAETLEQLRSLPLKEEIIRVILGPGFRHRDAILEIERASKLNLQVINNCQDMSEQLIWCDLAILGSGSTFWEACCLAVPTVLVRMVENQNLIFNTAEASNAAILIDSARNLAKLKTEDLLINLIDDSATRLTLSGRAKSLCDGQGAKRVAHEMTALISKPD